MTTATQLSLYDTAVPAPLPVLVYNGEPGHRASDTSAAGARAIKPRVASLQARIVLALYATPGLTQPALDRLLGTEATRASRPRVTELRIAGIVRECGQCPGEYGVPNAMFELTDAGVAMALQFEKEANQPATGSSPRTSGVRRPTSDSKADETYPSADSRVTAVFANGPEDLCRDENRGRPSEPEGRCTSDRPTSMPVAAAQYATATGDALPNAASRQQLFPVRPNESRRAG
jgi:hypothetical protein